MAPGLHLRGNAVVPSEAIQQNQQGQGGQSAHESRHVQGKMEFQSLRVEVSKQVQKFMKLCSLSNELQATVESVNKIFTKMSKGS